LPLYNGVFASLRSRESLGSIETAVEEALKDAENAEAIAFLLEELNAYNNWLGPTVAADATADKDDDSHREPEQDDTSQDDISQDETSHGVRAGKTIKDSIESLLGKWLKNRVRKVFGVLNELLSIIL